MINRPANQSDYKKLVEIHRGDLSLVSKYKKGDGRVFAGKEIDPTSYLRWTEEKSILQEYGRDNDNVVSYYDILENENGNKVILMDLCDGTIEQFVCDSELIPLTSDDGQPVSPRKYFSITHLQVLEQCTTGMKYLHGECAIIHGDIKPSNFLLVRNKTTKGTLVKVCDFGLSRKLDENSSGVFSLSQSNRFFSAPECFHGELKKRRSADIYSLGILFYYVLTNGKYPFNNRVETNKEEPFSFTHLRQSYEGAGLTKEQAVCAVHLIKRMIRKKQEDRLNIEEVASHPLFWTPRKKIDFYKAIHSYLIHKSGYNLSRFDKDLLIDDAEGTDQIKVTPDRLPKEIFHDARHKDVAKGCKNVRQLLRVIRNTDAHLLDATTPKRLRSILGVRGINVDWNVFLLKFTSPYPQLLMHLYERMRHAKLVGDFYPLRPVTPKHGHKKSLVSHQKSPESRSKGSIASRDRTQENEALQKHLDELEAFVKENEIAGSDLYKYRLTVKYHDKVVMDETICFESGSHLLYPPDDDPLEASGEHQLVKLPRFGGTQDSSEKVRQDISKVLSLFCPGLKLRGQVGFTLLCKRCCQVQVFWSKGANSVKLEQSEDVRLFSYLDMWSRIAFGDFVNGPFCDIKLSIGKNPKTERGIVELDLSPCFPKALEDFIRSKQHDDEIAISLS